MKLFLNNKTPVLTEEDVPSWQCPDTCCFKWCSINWKLACSYFDKQCTESILTLYKIKYTIFLSYENYIQ